MTGVIGDVVLGPWRKRDRLPVCHHLVYIALDPAHELARLSDSQCCVGPC